MRISDLSSDVCSSDLPHRLRAALPADAHWPARYTHPSWQARRAMSPALTAWCKTLDASPQVGRIVQIPNSGTEDRTRCCAPQGDLLTRTWNAERSEEQTSELQSLMRRSYAVFCV